MIEYYRNRKTNKLIKVITIKRFVKGEPINFDEIQDFLSDNPEVKELHLSSLDNSLVVHKLIGGFKLMRGSILATDAEHNITVFHFDSELKNNFIKVEKKTKYEVIQ